MFQSSVKVDSKLEQVVREVENKSIGYNTLTAKYYNFPIVREKVKLEVKRAKRINLLEEHILLAGSTITPPPSIDELSHVLALDKVFVNNQCTNLVKNDLLCKEEIPFIITTEKGKKILKKKVREDIEVVEQEIFNDPLTAKFRIVDDIVRPSIDINNKEVKDIFAFNKIIKFLKDKPMQSKLTLNQMNNLFKNQENSFFSNNGQRVQKVLDREVLQVEKRLFGIIVIHDIVEDKLLFRLYNPLTNSFELEYEDRFNQLNDDQDQLFDDSFINKVFEDLSIVKLGTDREENVDKAEYEKRVQDIAKEKMGKIREQAFNSNIEDDIQEDELSIKYISDAKIRPKYLELLKSATNDVVILSGWINKQTVDDDFIELLKGLAKRRVLIVMAWGIEKRASNSNLKLNREMSRRLSKIKTPEGVNAVSLLLVGNQHKKEVIVDRKFHLLGSHNWLSYRGDYNIRGESVLYNEIPRVINKAFEEKKKICSKKLDDYLFNYLRNDRIEGKTQLSISAWVVLRLENDLLNKVEDILNRDIEKKEVLLKYIIKVSLALESRALNGGDHQLKEYIKEVKRLIDKFKLGTVEIGEEVFDLVGIIEGLAIKMEESNNVK
ncbi:hypothetical protein MWH25_04765 [Natroniella acetigena]|uniref:hypothetical protein n=1 Tax=Natroniella acetigena TaxID=52004 RepID=UPI00200A1AEC|nr:hypothetical protein [Natroniella acetigena]MCK8827058.1 hypothetical protein [Natroniella acetigena]